MNYKSVASACGFNSARENRDGSVRFRWVQACTEKPTTEDLEEEASVPCRNLEAKGWKVVRWNSRLMSKMVGNCYQVVVTVTAVNVDKLMEEVLEDKR